MTMPHLMNCSHSGEGWCIQCVREQHDELESMTTQRDALLAACQEVNQWIECDTMVDLEDLSDDCKEVLGIVLAAIAAATASIPKGPR